mmetsp:Transcript_19423/g.48641  ORF Transcript_19423/g.48641 Transcript_19423/m.48641 type:complete len:215 (-) Transcript_19423:3663-4307(-)
MEARCAGRGGKPYLEGSGAGRKHGLREHAGEHARRVSPGAVGVSRVPVGDGAGERVSAALGEEVAGGLVGPDRARVRVRVSQLRIQPTQPGKADADLRRETLEPARHGGAGPGAEAACWGGSFRFQDGAGAVLEAARAARKEEGRGAGANMPQSGFQRNFYVVVQRRGALGDCKENQRRAEGDRGCRGAEESDSRAVPRGVRRTHGGFVGQECR